MRHMYSYTTPPSKWSNLGSHVSLHECFNEQLLLQPCHKSLCLCVCASGVGYVCVCVLAIGICMHVCASSVVCVCVWWRVIGHHCWDDLRLGAGMEWKCDKCRNETTVRWKWNGTGMLTRSCCMVSASSTAILSTML